MFFHCSKEHKRFVYGFSLHPLCFSPWLWQQVKAKKAIPYYQKTTSNISSQLSYYLGATSLIPALSLLASAPFRVITVTLPYHTTQFPLSIRLVSSATYKGMPRTRDTTTTSTISSLSPTLPFPCLTVYLLTDPTTTPYLHPSQAHRQSLYLDLSTPVSSTNPTSQALAYPQIHFSPRLPTRRAHPRPCITSLWAARRGDAQHFPKEMHLYAKKQSQDYARPLVREPVPDALCSVGS